MHALQPGILYHTYLSRNDSHTGCDIGVWAQFTVFWIAGDRSPASWNIATHRRKFN